MKIAIMQPYFFPYLGYFSLIKNTDQFILFDPVQFIRHGWIERNRTLKPDKGWQYIAVPLCKSSQATHIKDTNINQEENWQAKILAQLTHYKKKAPFYKQTIDVINSALDCKSEGIAQLNYHILKTVCQYIDIPFNCQIFSEMNLEIEAPQIPDEWALNICKKLDNIDEYWNPEGGATFFDKSKYDEANIKLVFVKPLLNFYSQRRGPENFENGLSIIDVMMFNSPEQIRKMLDEYELF